MTQSTDTHPKWRSRIVGHGEVDPKSLEPNPMNWRTHPPDQRRGLAGILEEVGWVQDVIVNKRTGRLIDGHLRRDMAIAQDEPTIPVVYVDLDENEERKILATLDPLAAMAEVNSKRLSELCHGIGSMNDAVAKLLEGIRERNTLPDFIPTKLDEQSRLDTSEVITCPKCGHEFST